MTAINTIYDIIDKDNTNTSIKSLDEINKLCSTNFSGLNILFLNIKNTIITNIINSHNYITLLLIGDININLLDTTSSTTLYLDLLNSFNFTQYINCPTRPISNMYIHFILL
ncbi:hypothetical protein QTP88_015194 [Uroleucon formosanum]